jgi:3-oxoacyl-[acyl-carrier-protein] synthase III
MRFSRVRIERLAAVEAPDEIKSVEVESDLDPVYKRLGIPPHCLQALTGIEARRFWPAGREVAQGGVEAAEACLRGTHLEDRAARGKIGALISTSVSKEYLEPSVAALVHGDLGLAEDCLNFDISNACLGFLSAMGIAARFIEGGQTDYVLIVASESSRNVVTRTVQRLHEPNSTMDDYRSFLPTLTLGSGAVAMLMCSEEVATSEHRFDGVVSKANTAYNRICMGTWDWMRTDAPRLMSEGVALAKRVWSAAEGEFGWSADVLESLICHQVGAAHLATLCNELRLPVERAFKTYPHFGNMGAAALPFTLFKAFEAGAVKSGDRVALMGIGSGLNCSMGQVTW